MTAFDPGDLLPGGRFAMGVIHPGSPTLKVRYRQGVLVNPSGFPDWSLCARAVVELPPPEAGLTRDEVRVVDILAANALLARAAGTDAGDPLWSPGGGGLAPGEPGGGPAVGEPSGGAGPAPGEPGGGVDLASATPGGGEGPAVATPAGWCWAHVGDSRQLALVPIELHGSYVHAGGMTTLPVGGRGLRVDDQPVRVGPALGDEVPEDVMDILERLLGWPLPPAYRRFLATTNGAGPAQPAVLPGFGLVADQPWFGIAREDRHQDVSYAVEWTRDRLTVDFLPIGYVQGGLLAVKVSGDDLDSVWYWDDDDPRARDAFGPDYISAHLLHRCADSIDDFWAALVRPARPLVELAHGWVDDGLAVETRDEWMGTGLPARLRAPWQPTAQQSTRDPLTTMFEAH